MVRLGRFDRSAARERRENQHRQRKVHRGPPPCQPVHSEPAMPRRQAHHRHSGAASRPRRGTGPPASAVARVRRRRPLRTCLARHGERRPRNARRENVPKPHCRRRGPRRPRRSTRGGLRASRWSLLPVPHVVRLPAPTPRTRGCVVRRPRIDVRREAQDVREAGRRCHRRKSLARWPARRRRILDRAAPGMPRRARRGARRPARKRPTVLPPPPRRGATARADRRPRAPRGDARRRADRSIRHGGLRPRMANEDRGRPRPGMPRDEMHRRIERAAPTARW